MASCCRAFGVAAAAAESNFYCRQQEVEAKSIERKVKQIILKNSQITHTHKAAGKQVELYDNFNLAKIIISSL